MTCTGRGLACPLSVPLPALCAGLVRPALRRVVSESGLCQRQTERDGPEPQGAPNARRARAMPRSPCGRGIGLPGAVSLSWASRAVLFPSQPAPLGCQKKAPGFPAGRSCQKKSRKGLRRLDRVGVRCRTLCLGIIFSKSISQKYFLQKFLRRTILVSLGLIRYRLTARPRPVRGVEFADRGKMPPVPSGYAASGSIRVSNGHRVSQ